MKHNRLTKTLAITTAIFIIPLVFSCAKQPEKPETGITYTLLWDTEINPIENHIRVSKDDDGITTIYKDDESGNISDNLKVLVFTDLHLDHKQDACNYTYTMMAKNIMDVKPDLVIFCGDNITSIENAPRARQFCQLLEDLNVYWAFILGNHEGKEYPVKPMLSRPQMVDIFTKYPHCLIDGTIKKTSDGEEVWGNGNAAINILNSDNEVAETFFFLDSGTMMSEEDWKVNYATEVAEFIEMGKASPTETEFYDYLRDSQITWYSEIIDKIHNDNTNANSIVFSHVPIKDMEDAYLTFARKSIEENPGWGKEETDIGIGSGDMIWPYTDFSKYKESITGIDVDMIHGLRAEEMCYSPHDLHYYNNEGDHTAIFNAMVDHGGKRPAFFCGHDHQNNFALTQKVNDDVTLTMGYVQPACYSSNNFWTKGMLGWYPLKEPNAYHLIQGYTTLEMTLNGSSPFTITNFDNYTEWKSENHYEEALDLIALSRSSPAYKPAWDFENNKSTYSNDPNDPLQKDPPEPSI